MTASAAAASNSTSLLTSYIAQNQAALSATQQQIAASAYSNSGSSSTASATSAAAVSSDYSTFLQILTAQLQNQDPLSATDTNQFTQELVEFSGVEQQLNTNNYLQQLVSSDASGVKSLLNYVGQYVEVPANNQVLIQNGVANLSYTLPSAAQNVTMTVSNSSGATVATLSGPTASGVNNVSWNGQDASGNQLPDGAYTLAVSATDPTGAAITPTNIDLIAQVTGVYTATAAGGNDLNLGPYLSASDANVAAVFSASSIPSASSTTSGTPNASTQPSS